VRRSVVTKFTVLETPACSVVVVVDATVALDGGAVVSASEFEVRGMYAQPWLFAIAL
tara:strand:- start:411 stop:581 length:171 start_codon:yes stop_codon:yes gene_type:complete